VQKLVTIYLDNMGYEGSTMFKGHSNKHGLVEEHLQQHLEEGWWVVSTSSFGSASEGYSVRGWIAVVLEKDTGLT
jgi:hypothetical protein